MASARMSPASPRNSVLFGKCVHLVSTREWDTPQAPVPTLQATQHEGLHTAEETPSGDARRGATEKQSCGPGGPWLRGPARLPWRKAEGPQRPWSGAQRETGVGHTERGPGPWDRDVTRSRDLDAAEALGTQFAL